MTQRWHFIPRVICKYIANYFKLNDSELGRNDSKLGRETTWGETTCFPLENTHSVALSTIVLWDDIPAD